LHGKLSITVLVEGFEYLGKAVTLCLCEQLARNEGKGGLLHGGLGIEALQVAERGQSSRIVNSNSS
jgi:hypothetical protein